VQRPGKSARRFPGVTTSSNSASPPQLREYHRHVPRPDRPLPSNAHPVAGPRDQRPGSDPAVPSSIPAPTPPSTSHSTGKKTRPADNDGEVPAGRDLPLPATQGPFRSPGTRVNSRAGNLGQSNYYGNAEGRTCASQVFNSSSVRFPASGDERRDPRRLNVLTGTRVAVAPSAASRPGLRKVTSQVRSPRSRRERAQGGGLPAVHPRSRSIQHHLVLRGDPANIPGDPTRPTSLGPGPSPPTLHPAGLLQRQSPNTRGSLQAAILPRQHPRARLLQSHDDA